MTNYESRLLRALLERQDLDLLGEILGGIAHDLNNALTVANGNAELLLERLPSRLSAPVDGSEATEADEQLVRDASTIVRWTDTSMGIARQLLALSRRLRDGRCRFDVDSLIRESADLLRYRCEQEDILLIAHVDEPTAEIDGLFGQLQQALVNLIQNSREALHASEEGAGGGTIQVTGEVAEGRVRIVVTDDGPGMRPEMAETAFEPFASTKTPSDGSGLGLTVARATARAHGGDLVLETVEGGVSVALELPLASTEGQ